ncbi:MAG: hypothetical protein AB7U85_05910 [Alphaproteobacteria bacterium]
MAATNLAYKEYEKFETEIDDSNSNNDTEKQEHFLVSPILVDLADNGGNVAFRTFEDSINWASEELDTWRYIAVSSSPSQRLPFLADILAQQLSPAENILETAHSAINGDLSFKEAAGAIRRYLDAYAAFCCVHSKSTLGQMALTMEKYRPMVLGMLAGATGCVRPEAGRGFDKSADVEAFTFGYAIALQFRSGSRPETLSEKIAELENRINDFCKKFEPSEFKLTDLSEECLSLQKQIDEIKFNMESIEEINNPFLNDLYSQKESTAKTVSQNKKENVLEKDENEQIMTRKTIGSEKETDTQMPKAVNYWLEMANMHNRKSAQSLYWFIITGLFSITTMMMIIVALQQSGFIFRGHFDFVTFAVLSVPMFVSFLLLGMLAFSRIKNDKLADKAREKIALLETLNEMNFGDLTDVTTKKKIFEEVFIK